jgi:hypothetical protein
MTSLRTIRSLALLASVAAAIAFSPFAHAEEGEGGGGDLQKKIQAKMEKILELMRANEAALLKLSTGKAAATKKVDVEVPDAPKAEGASGTKGSDGAGASGEGTSGKDVTKEIEKLLESVTHKGGSIPDEIKQLIEMIPL